MPKLPWLGRARTGTCPDGLFWHTLAKGVPFAEVWAWGDHGLEESPAEPDLLQDNVDKGEGRQRSTTWALSHRDRKRRTIFSKPGCPFVGDTSY